MHDIVTVVDKLEVPIGFNIIIIIHLDEILCDYSISNSVCCSMGNTGYTYVDCTLMKNKCSLRLYSDEK